MPKFNISAWFKSFKKRDIKKAEQQDDPSVLKAFDPLDPTERMTFNRRRNGRGQWEIHTPEAWQPAKTVADFPHQDFIPASQQKSLALAKSVTDAALPRHFAMDYGSTAAPFVEADLPTPLLSWYVSQTFIGHQACALINQHWLVNKACTQSAEDAARNGWELKSKNGEDLDPEVSAKLKAFDVEYKVMKNAVELERFKNIFGIRIAIFHVESDDPDYYRKPFNPDGVTPGSYKGMSQVDPYWTTPMMTAETTADPSGMNFYDPDYWIISGRKYHRSHLVISRGPDVADILKPTYYFGGIPLTQLIYERVYAAERTANEAPLLAMTKRTTAIFVDLAKAAANQQSFRERMNEWIEFRNNEQVRVLGKDDKLEQQDTALSDLDAVIMNQYQLVAAIAETPATKLLGTSPKGFNATGEFEEKSYRDKLRTVQAHGMEPLLDRHYLLLSKSEGMDLELCISWNPTDNPTAAELAELNDRKADTDGKNVNIGAISPDDVRNRLKEDPNSGYNHLSDEEAEGEPGMSPEILAKLQTAGAKQEAAGAQASKAGEKPGQAAQAVQGEAPTDEGEQPLNPDRPGTPVLPAVMTAKEPGITTPPQIGQNENSEAATAQVLKDLVGILASMQSQMTQMQTELSSRRRRTSKPSTKGLKPTVTGINGADAEPDPSNPLSAENLANEGSRVEA